ncbi:MAG: NusG domain II-containing protein [Candidatus Limivivens sp.]|nr:NusG domain II-containing protein [Candidatus Limivivens sp.]
MKRSDRLLAAGIFLCALGLFAGLFLLRRPGSQAEILIDGQSFGIYSLQDSRVIDTGTGNRLEIRDGTIRMIWADCPDELCLHQKAASRTGENIVCLPHKLVVRILSGEEAEYDSISG